MSGKKKAAGPGRAKRRRTSEQESIAAPARETFATSRMLDYFRQKELAIQTGHDEEDWPLVILKELADNALDACEEAGVSPELLIILEESGITVADNGPGIPPETVAGILDFARRVSSKEAYVEPTRGAQGNALKTLIAIPFVLDGEQGRIVIEGRGVRHEITVRVDHIRQTPVIERATAQAAGTTGTKIRIEWPADKASYIDGARERFLQIAEDYAWLNPHIRLRLDVCGETRVYEPTAPDWAKWTPSQPTPAHWYTLSDLTRLVAACIAKDEEAGRDRTVRDFVSRFKGLSSSAKQKRVTEAAGLSRASLSELGDGHGLDEQRIGSLLGAMQSKSKAPKAATLGIIGEAHFRQRYEVAGCAMQSFNYTKVVSKADADIPSVIEVAFAAHQGALDPSCGEYGERRLITGVNWSPGLVNPFRELGEVGRSLDAVLGEQWAGRREPILLVLHAACPRVRYADHGKSSVLLTKGDDDASE